jgi:hypothetical protein
METIDRKYFFDNIPFPISQKQEIDFLLTKFDESELLDCLHKYAYFLATAKKETAGTFKPVIEGYWIKNNRKEKLYSYYSHNNPEALKTIFPNGITGVSYEGRGYVQVTHKYNYGKFRNIISIKYDVDITENPDIICENKDIAFDICELGMSERAFSFTGKILNDYFNSSKNDFYNARKIINGLDRAGEISNIAQHYYEYLRYNE